MTARPEPPVAPHEPDPADCCGEGCARCVFDLHDVKLERYREALEQWRLRWGKPGDADPPHC